jgi:3D (Asp-Asp-Asp) domain-containing protein
MPIKIISPKNDNQFSINSAVDFQGTADNSMTKIELIADNKWSLSKANVVNNKWSVSYQFNSSGDRNITVKGFDNADHLIDSTQVKIKIQNRGFDFPEPANTAIVKQLKLWGTYYYVHLAQEDNSGISLLDMSGNSLGSKLSERDWCAAAVEGTVAVKNSSGNYKTYNYAGVGSISQVNCRLYYPRLPTSVINKTNKVRFGIAKGTYGDGTNGLSLVPYRSIAVDRNKIPIGSVIYIPEARNVSVILPSGQTVTHDGYFYAADVGGAVQDNHIDVFLGLTQNNPFSFIKSNSNNTFTAYLIQDNQIANELKTSHQAV